MRPTSKQVIVLAMHGAPPKGFPEAELAELVGLHMRLEHAHGSERAGIERRHDELEGKVRGWPRTARNDPFWAGTYTLAERLRRATGCEVIVGFNEFCAPGLDEALDSAADRARDVVVVTPMMTRGGEHSEADIPRAIEYARARHPGVSIRYVWPFESAAVAGFLADQIARGA